ncbi:hypothetical protein [Alkaliphilus peptidifermentans]|uniref:UbiA prenyltransferase family protein n=1 Tax=Alkaliphilus peptidifermentans DSM 18978 TaxID=1120976 RepID=A0A1G5KKC9_9FIRM|nr:hypothetical protein [Alkaliphilus peptidifermentans]SCZ01075.1 hypothetical protein SAMN03080606_03552 [Alkaliphilus peptidifermentans DSM 18978]
MWVEIFKRYIAVLLIGFVIKWLDDEVDFKEEAAIDKKKLLNIFDCKLPYCLLFLALAMMLDTYYSFSLFTAAYIIGMFQIPLQRLPFGLKSYQEIIILIIINTLFVPIDIFIHALILIFTIQLLDDIVDFNYDKKYSFKNYAVKFGKGEVIIFILILLVAAIMLNWINTLIILPVAIFINYLYSRR